MHTMLESQVGRVWNRAFGEAMTDKWQRRLLPNLRWNQEIYGETLLDLVTPETRWLDAGCGHHILAGGLEATETELVRRAHLVVGVDVHLNDRPGNTGLLFRACGDLNNLPFPDGTFQLVSCNMVVEHLANPSMTFRQLAAVLSPGGHLVIHTPNKWGYVIMSARIAKAILPRKWILRLIRWSESREAEDVFPTLYRANTIRKLRSLLANVGLAERSSRLLLGPQPVFRRFAPVGIQELLLRRISLLSRFCFLRCAILAVYQKPVSA